MPAPQPLPGDVVLTRSTGWVGWIIRFGAALLDLPNIRNHVIVVHHGDAAGTLWGIEGRPGGVGWVDMSRVLKEPLTISNAEQPKSWAQRDAICQAAETALKTTYDYDSIAWLATEALRLDRLWQAREFTEDGAVPGGLICSALADWAYERAGLPNPGDAARTRYTRPADWDLFIQSRGWEE